MDRTDGSALPAYFGRYVLLKALGRGAMGDVHLARPINRRRGLPSLVVLKRLHDELAAKEAFVSRFRHEAAVAVSVDSQHVAKAYDIGAVGSALYIVMEHVDGWPVSRVVDAVVKSGRHASIASVLDLMIGGLRGLEALHSARDPASGASLAIVHRDLSPKNLMVGEDGRVRIIDLGLGTSKLQDWRTRTGVVMGSLGYMPPEQARGERVDLRADIYAFAAVMYEMLSLRNYVPRGTVPEMMAQALRPVFIKPSTYRPDVPESLDQVMQTALSADPEQRYPSARAFREALERVITAEQARGGMDGLLDELFGATRAARTAELQELLQMPDPGQEAFDTRPTRVFALSAGVAPDQVPTVARTVATSIASPQGALPMSAPADSSLLKAPRSAQSAPLTSILFRRDDNAVPISILLIAVLIAAAMGGGMAVVVRRMISASSPTVIVPPSSVRVPVVAAPTIQRSPSVASPSATAPAKVEPERAVGRAPSVESGPSIRRAPSVESGPSIRRAPSVESGSSIRRAPSVASPSAAAHDTAASGLSIRGDPSAEPGRSTQRGASVVLRPTTNNEVEPDRRTVPAATEPLGARNHRAAMRTQRPVDPPPIPLPAAPEVSQRTVRRARSTHRQAQMDTSGDALTALNAKLDRLRAQVDGLRRQASGARRSALTALLIDIRQTRASNEPRRKAEGLERLHRQLRDLAPR